MPLIENELRQIDFEKTPEENLSKGLIHTDIHDENVLFHPHQILFTVKSRGRNRTEVNEMINGLLRPIEQIAEHQEFSKRKFIRESSNFEKKRENVALIK